MVEHSDGFKERARDNLDHELVPFSSTLKSSGPHESQSSKVIKILINDGETESDTAIDGVASIKPRNSDTANVSVSDSTEDDSPSSVSSEPDSDSKSSFESSDDQRWAGGNLHNAIIKERKTTIEEPDSQLMRMHREARKAKKFSARISGSIKEQRRRGKKRSLQSRLFELLQPTDPERKGFFPAGVLADMITTDCVRNELSKHLEDTHDDQAIARYARQICQYSGGGGEPGGKMGPFCKVFVILVLVEEVRAIVKLLELPAREQVKDSDLPLIKAHRSGHGGVFDLRRSRQPRSKLKCFGKGWTQLHIMNFEEWQWTTLAPFFGKHNQRKEVMHYTFQPQVTLPFTFDGRRGTKGGKEKIGGFGRVFEADIHPDHHDFHEEVCNRSLGTTDRNENTNADCTCKLSFAIKCLHSQDRVEFKREVDTLKKLSNGSHPHLISLLATYEQHGNFYLIFPRADIDLLGYWKQINPTPGMDRDTVLWVAQQCKGIANGVLKIHEYHTSNLRLELESSGKVFGNHGDIKPENVLWFSDSAPDKVETGSRACGVLKLSDFGGAEFSTHRTASMIQNNNSALSYDYRAPERDLPGGGRKGRQYDIWTLGYLYLGLITWLLGGAKLVQEFLEKRTSPDHMYPYEVEPGKAIQKATVKPQVTAPGTDKYHRLKFIERLYSMDNCTKFIHEFLDLVKDGMLVVKKNDPQRRDRLTIQEVHVKLHRMVEKCDKDTAYCCGMDTA
ncbi:kinase-like domain-containing protein [Cercophora scortea]|uniref:Kinase-like domain-containing protein n=1 Tax=Cercophora scortea TaxID=314031 RepID=A0AAE0J466_9PEZI|nr:kinase-like domain-containing protein [Cercophora scortea]